MPKILIFSQDSSLRKTLTSLLISNSYDVSSFFVPDKAINSIREETYDLVFIDFPQNNVVNHELITAIHCFQDLLPIIVITDDNKIHIAQEAIKNGATTYITKPLNPEALLLTLTIALSQADTLIENLLYRRDFQKISDSNFSVTSSDYMLQVYSLVEKIAQSDSAIMLTGETGTGKETIARRIHAKSQRAKYNFCKVDCAALPLKMQESELFGYVRKITAKKPQNIQGIFEKNNGGTIFLDNIDVLPMNTQIKLLYLLKNRKIQLIGSSEMIDIDIRLIVGSTSDLQNKTHYGEFCESLYLKLSMVPILLPPLRERCKDVPELVENFLERFAKQNSKHVKISSHALTVLCEYDWPGNIEQLKTLIERLVSANETGQIDREDLPDELFKETGAEVNWNKIIDDKLDDIVPLKKYLQTQEHSYMKKVLEHSGGDKNLTAKKLGISLASFYRKWQESML
jgi:two-component system, NtrC family, response regulator